MSSQIYRFSTWADQTALCITLQEKRIYDLKKKNQELEKFKFVLDYKIKELRRQMEPRENEIKRMKEQIKKVQTDDGYPVSERMYEGSDIRA